MSRIRARFWDSTGQRYALPTWPWRMAPPHLLTRRQLTAVVLRPGGQDVQGQVLWSSRRYRARGGVRVAFLYDVRLALPKRVPTVRQRTALAKANAARRTWFECLRDVGYVLSRRLGTCND